MLKILIDSYKIYEESQYKFNIPLTIENRTTEYLQKSCYILQWFKDNYVLTNDKNNIVKIAEIFNDFKYDEHYINLTKAEKKKYTKRYLIEYFANNIITKKYYKEKTEAYRNILFYWKKIDNIDQIDDNNNLNYL